MALPTKLALEVVTPDRSLLREEVDEVVVPGTEGELGVLPGHTPLLSSLKIGELWYRQGSERHYLAIAFGFVEVLPDRVTVLADVGERAREIDVQRAERAKKRAEELLVQQAQQPMTPNEVDFETANVALVKAMNRLQVASKARARA
jgi:F-type H+-transporting ATPase subunit epsilon